MPNVENINKVIAALEADKEVGTHFLMGDFMVYISPVPDDGERGKHHACKTAFCIAGWANYLRLKEEAPDILNCRDFEDHVTRYTAAAYWLDINWTHAQPLFFMRTEYRHNLIPDLDSSMLKWFDDLPTPQRYASAIRVLEILRDENVVDWPRALKEAGVKLPNQDE